MLRKIAVALLLVTILFESGIGTALADQGAGDILIQKGDENDNVILLQLRLQDLGFYDYKITGFFGDFTSNALKDFQKANPPLSSDGKAGAQTLKTMYSNDALRKPVEPRVKPKPKPTTTTKKKKFGVMEDWFKWVQYNWKRGETCTVTDLDTQISYRMVRVGGSYHADVAPLTKADNNKFIQSYKADGGSYPNWDRRAVVVSIHGKLVAASTNGMPHGSTGILGNGMSQGNQKLQVCIHFLNSRTHIHNMVDPAHQYQVKRANGQHPSGRPPALADD
jgi:hypothetical protein